MERSIILLLYGAIGLMLSHTISTFYTAIFAVAYILFYVKKLKEKGMALEEIMDIAELTKEEIENL